jgi:NADH dehydrogenase
MTSVASQASKSDLPHIVILGAGFGGLFAARCLGKANAKVTVIDRHNYHLFQPLLYQVAGAALSPSDVSWPIRSLLKGQSNTQVVMAEVQDIRKDERQVITDQGVFDYDYLIVATGAQTSFFGHKEWSSHAFDLKDLEDATAMREHILRCMEQAELTADEEVRRQLLTFIVIGGGPTGVEMAGIIAELFKIAAPGDFRRLSPDEFRVLLVEGGKSLLTAFSEKNSAFAEQTLKGLDVEVKTSAMVQEINESGVVLSDGSRVVGTVIWCAGVEPTPAAKWLKLSTAPDGRIPVGPDLHPEGCPEVFVIGDLAWCAGNNGKPLPGVAPVAKQQGRFVARCLRNKLSGKSKQARFRYRDFGMLATIGRGRAVAGFDRLSFCGWLTWWFWGVIHIYFLIARQSRFMVALKWLLEYITFQRGSRLIMKQ